MVSTVVTDEGLAVVPLERLEAELVELAGHLAAGEARWLVLLAEFDRRRGWTSWGSVDCVHWLGWRLSIAAHTAREKLRVAHALAQLPLIRDAFARGELSYSQVRAITRVAGPQNEQALVHTAKGLPAARLERVVNGIANADKQSSQRWAQQQFDRRGYMTRPPTHRRHP